jgi:hypothetical protein
MMRTTPKRKNPPETRGLNLDEISEQRAAVHRRQITLKAPRGQVRRAVKTTPEEWRISRELACIRGAAQIVVGHHQIKKMEFESVEIFFDEPPNKKSCGEWRMPRSSSSPSLCTDLKVFCAPLAAEVLFHEFPRLEYRAYDYFYIRTCASCLKYYHPKTTLTRFIENALPDVFDVLIREHLSVAKIARALIERGRLNGVEILKLLRSNDDASRNST